MHWSFKINDILPSIQCCFLAKRKTLLKLSMIFFNSHLTFHLRKQTKQSFMEDYPGNNNLPTSIIISEASFSYSLLQLNKRCLFKPTYFHTHISKFTYVYLLVLLGPIVFVCWVNCYFFVVIIRKIYKMQQQSTFQLNDRWLMIEDRQTFFVLIQDVA